MLAFLLGLQGGYTEYSCFLCLWDSRADHEHYQKVEWPLEMSCSQVNGILLDRILKSLENVLLPGTHIKFGLVKQFVKTLDLFF